MGTKQKIVENAVETQSLFDRKKSVLINEIDAEQLKSILLKCWDSVDINDLTQVKEVIASLTRYWEYCDVTSNEVEQLYKLFDFFAYILFGADPKEYFKEK